VRRYLAPIGSVLWMMLKRIWHNYRLVLAILLGFTVAAGVLASIPLFSSGALTRVLEAELARERKPGRQPAALGVTYYAAPPRQATPQQLDQIDRYLAEAAPGLLGVPVGPYSRFAALDVTFFEPVDPLQVNPDVARWLVVGFASDLASRVELLDGRHYRAGRGDGGEFEAIVDERVLDTYDFTVGSLFWAPVARGQGAPRVQVRVVGVFRQLEPDHPLYPVSGGIDQAFLIDEQTFRQDLLAVERADIYRYSWYLGVEEADLNLANLPRFMNGLREVQARVAQMAPDIHFASTPLDVYARYLAKAASLRTLLLMLATPLLCLTAYYLLVTANLLVDRQRAEIATMRSRGAGLFQIVGLYLMEGLLYGALAVTAGRWLAVLLARAMGAAAGFVQFVDRRPLPIVADESVWVYSLWAILLALAAMLLPAVQAARESIVTYKMQAARESRPPFWQRYFVDLLLLGAALYGYRTLRTQFETRLRLPGTEGGDLLFDPLHFVLPALFIGSAALLLLRLLPLLTGLFDRLARRRGGAAVHLAMAQVARSPRLSAPVVMLLTLTVGLGVYSASAARTLEENLRDRAYHRIGADASLLAAWQYDAEDGFTEPPFHLYEDLPGVRTAARVFLERDLEIVIGGRVLGKGQLMAIETTEFARTARFRNDLFAPYHPNHYLNLLGRAEEAALLYTGFMERARLQPGDQITLRSGQRQASFVVYGAVPYWPAFYGGRGKDTDFFVTNLEYVQATFGLLPYRVWLNLEPDAGELAPLTRRLMQQDVFTLRAEDARQEATVARRDPQQTGLYGILTIGFVVSAALTVLGFLLYAVLSLRSRMLQVGVLRAMGLSAGQLLAALGLEQAYTVGVGTAAGTGLGLLAARLFIPFLQFGGDLADQVPPFRIVTDPIDQFRLYAVLGVMLAGGLFSLLAVISRMQINQAVKLGEDS
jgi:putative ABC transport system permease protein